MVALGVVLYELTTGTHPFRAATELATLLAISSPDPPPPPPPEYPAQLRAIVLRALAKVPAERYSTMRAFAADLDAFAAGISDDDVASFARESLRERTHALREELREAARAADARAEERASVKAPRPSRSTGPLVTAVTVGIAGAALGAIAFRTPEVALRLSVESRGRAASLTRAAPSATPPSMPSAAPAPEVRSAAARAVAIPPRASASASAPPVAPAPTSSGPAPTRFREAGF
jgi:type II secretory pathway component HofQ